MYQRPVPDQNVNNMAMTSRFLPIEHNGHRVKEFTFTPKKSMTRDQIKNSVQKFSLDMSMKGRNNEIMIGLPMKDGSTRTGKYTVMGETVEIFDPDDFDSSFLLDIPNKEGWATVPDKYESFHIYIKTGNAPVGRGTILSDCLYEILRNNVHDLPWASDEYLKKFLNIRKHDGVPISKMKEIENELPDYAINVTGDYIYTSTKKSPHVLNIKLLNEHYTHDNSGQYKLYSQNYTEKEIAFYDFYDKKEAIMILIKGYDKPRIVSRHTFNDIRSDYTFVLIDIKKVYHTEEFYERHYQKYPAPYEEIMKTYNHYIDDATIIKQKTNGMINFFVSGSIKQTALELFSSLNKLIIPEIIKQDEALWIESCKSGALIWSNDYTGPIYKYDYISNYPSIMCNSHFLIPIKRGEFKSLTKETFDSLPFYNYGIYRVIITGYNSNLFRPNENNYYTGLDIQRARDLGYKLEIIIDDQPNFLYYPRSSIIQGHYLFQRYVDILFKLKKQGIQLAKALLNIIWGALSQKNKISLKVNINTNEPLVIKEDRTIISQNYLSPTVMMVTIVKNNLVYTTPWARIAPFLLSKARIKLSKEIEPHLEYVRRVHTDSIFSTKKLPIQTGFKLGDMKYEGYSNDAEIKSNMVYGKFI